MRIVQQMNYIEEDGLSPVKSQSGTNLSQSGAQIAGERGMSVVIGKSLEAP